MAHAILLLADRYGILILKETCDAAITSTLSLKNVIAALLLADTHSCAELTKKCLALMKGNIQTLRKTEDWRVLKKNPEILDMVLEFVAD